MVRSTRHSMWEATDDDRLALLHLVFATTWLGTDFYFNFVVTLKLRTLEPSILGDVTTSLRRVTRRC